MKRPVFAMQDEEAGPWTSDRGLLAADHAQRFPASNLGIAAFAKTDVTDDMKTIDVPILILHGDDDQIAPVGGDPP